MTVDALDYCLKHLGYRYNVASLKNTIRKSRWIRLQPDGRWTHEQGREAETRLRRSIPIAPADRRMAWTGLRDTLAHDVRRFMTQRAAKLQSLDHPYRFGLDWDEHPRC